eukprot:Rhum_TRINITY_DN13203_c0_g1::Rhum_TRINITY_DN13203_c0_g1_i1::g.57987::m.57987
MEEAASAVASAGIMLVMNGSGNGFVPCGADLCKGTVYADLCMTRPADFSRALAQENPELFYGFWGRYHNMVAEARLKPPHSGLDTLLRWRSRLNAQKLVETIEGELPSFFAYSQAADGVLSSAVPDGCEVHGSALYWQCADACTDKVWRLPDGHRFEIHPASLTCKARPAPDVPPPPQLLTHYNNECDSTETGANPPIDAATSHPQCPQCKGQAVPNLIELGVETCVDSAFSALNYVTWRLAVEELAREDPEEDATASPSVVVLELGCSSAVPTAREEAEEFVCKKN